MRKKEKKWGKNGKWGKRAFLDDFFDLFTLVVAVFFLLMITQALLSGGQELAEQRLSGTIDKLNQDWGDLSWARQTCVVGVEKGVLEQGVEGGLLATPEGEAGE